MILVRLFLNIYIDLRSSRNSRFCLSRRQRSRNRIMIIFSFFKNFLIFLLIIKIPRTFLNPSKQSLVWKILTIKGNFH